MYIIPSVSLLLTLLHFAATFKDWDSYKGIIIQKFEDKYNARIHISGKIEVSLITPKIIIYNMYMQCNSNGRGKLSDLISINRVEVRPSLLWLFLFSLQPKSITLFGLKGSKRNFINIVSERTSKVDIVIKDSQVNLNNDFGNYRSNVNIKEIAIRKSGNFSGEVDVGDKNYGFSGKMNITKKSVRINTKSDFVNLFFLGNRNQKGLHGRLLVSINNSSNSVDWLAKIINLSFLACIVPSENIKMSSNVNLNEDEFTLTGLKIDSKNMQASGAVRNDRKNNHTKVDINFRKINLGSMQNGSQRIMGMKEILECFKSVVPRNLSLDFNIGASSIQYRNRILDRFHTVLKFADGEIKVSMLLQFPGTDNISRLSGKVSNNLIMSEFDGNLLVKGENFESFISYFFPSIKIKKGERDQFTMSSRLHFTPRMLSISDIRLMNDNDEGFWQGSIKVHYTKKHNAIDGRFSARNLNVDKYDYSLLSSLLRVEWLKSLKYDANIKTNVNNFTLNNAKIGYLGFLLKIENSSLIADKIRLSGEDFNITGNIKILVDRKYTKPLLDISITGDKFNASVLKLPNLVKVRKDSGNKINQVQWSKKKFDFLSDKDDFDANVHINVTKLKIGQDILKDFNLDAVIINNTITFRKINYVLEHGEVSFQGYLRSNSMYIKFFIADLDIKRIGQAIEIDNLNGRVSLNGEVKAQGKSFYDWANTLSGKIYLLQAHEIEFTNVDFNSFIESLFSSKNKSEVSTLTHIGIYNGSTFFRNVTGQASIKSGICSISLQFRIDQASGSVSSNLVLYNFSLISLSRFFFIPPGYSSPVHIDMHLNGPIWSPKMSFDEDLIFNTLISIKR